MKSAREPIRRSQRLPPSPPPTHTAETTKTRNKQISNNKNSSRRALEYDKGDAETLWSKENEDGWWNYLESHCYMWKMRQLIIYEKGTSAFKLRAKPEFQSVGTDPRVYTCTLFYDHYSTVTYDFIIIYLHCGLNPLLPWAEEGWWRPNRAKNFPSQLLEESLRWLAVTLGRICPAMTHNLPKHKK